jgi:CRP-like cAMP-binding protein
MSPCPQSSQTDNVEASPGAACSRFIQKLSAATNLSDDEQQALTELCAKVRTVEAKRDIIRDGENPGHVHIVLEGWAARYKVLADGSRQITAFLLPGDICDLHITILSEMDHGIVALTDTRVAYVPHQVMENLPINRPQLGRALWRATLIDEAVLRSWLVNVGRRDAEKRIANLFCELHARLSLVGLVHDGQFTLPLTQDVIADATALTAVHVNRTLQKLRGDGLIILQGRELTITNLAALARLGGFDPNYLHRERLRQL